VDDPRDLELSTPNLGGRRGVLSDWTTQRWVQFTGKRVDLSDHPWLRSSGARFGDPGFYFFVEKEPGRGWARYVRTFQEAIRVYVDAQGTLRTDHDLWIWGARFLRLHYRMRKRGAA